MKVIVFGATGPTGALAVDEALARGHEVTAFARRALERSHPRLTVRQGDATDPRAVQDAIRGHEAVLSALGAPPRDGSGVRERGTRCQLGAMKAVGVRRLVSLSSLGVGDSHTTLPWYMAWLLVPLYLRRVFADHERQEALIAQSDVDWTVVRPPALTDDEPAAAVRHGTDLRAPMSMSIARANVARFMVDQLENPSYVRSFAWVTS